jgi:TetR/AcrR family acrAB operon transcriptional repressor
MRRTKAEAEITRQHLLKAALTVFSRQGYADTRLEDIAEEASVTRGAIYHHFGGKAELYNALVADTSAQIQPVIEQALGEGGTSLTVLRRMFVRTLVYAAQDADFRAVMELTLFKTAIVPELQEGIKMKTQGIRAMIEFMAEQVQQGIVAGEIRPDVDPHDAAISLLAYQNGLLTLWLLSPDLFSLAERTDRLADIFFRGIAAAQ